MPNYWLDGIFDETIVPDVVDNDFIPVPDFVGSINDFIFYDGKKGLGYYRVCKSIEEVVVDLEEFKTSPPVSYKPAVILCKNFVYCEDRICEKRHWYRSGYKCRLFRWGQLSSNPVFWRLEEKEALDRRYKKYLKEGVEVSIE
jgi:hypothetical protein